MSARWLLWGSLVAMSAIVGCNANDPVRSSDQSQSPPSSDPRDSAASLLSNSAEAATVQETTTGGRTMRDFMTMDVCVDANDHALPGVIPGDSQCRKRRDIRVGEAPPYLLHNFGYPDSACGDSGTIDKTNAPVTRHGVTRIVSTTIRRSGCSSRANRVESANGDATSDDGASIQWADDKYGFIMGSYSPVALSAFQSSLCHDNPRSSRRFFRSWVIAPSSLPAVGTGDVGVFEGAMAKGARPAMMGQCPARFRRALTSWTVQPFTYKSNRRLTSVISSHFAQTAPDGQSPGNAMQMERTYWTSEFGISRWEKWTREDYDRKDGKSVADLAAQLVARGRCSNPQLPSVIYSSALRESGASTTKAYVRVLENPRTGESHRWLMTLCEDYSNARVEKQAGRKVAPTALANDLYWEP